MNVTARLGIVLILAPPVCCVQATAQAPQSPPSSPPQSHRLRSTVSDPSRILLAQTDGPSPTSGAARSNTPSDRYAEARRRLVDTRIRTAGVTDERVLHAIEQTPRHEFVPAAVRRRAYFDMALPIGASQTISSPFIVASMTETLDPQPSDRVLEIGTGSGYQAAVLSPLVDEVYSIEIIESLGVTARQVLDRLGYDNVFTKIGDGFQGWPEKAPFDKIIVTCSPESVPVPLVEQLREGGSMIIPVGERYQQTLFRMIKKDGKLVRQPLRPTLFVPMTGTAEDGRHTLPDPEHPTLVNGDFELPPLTNLDDAAGPDDSDDAAASGDPSAAGDTSTAGDASAVGDTSPPLMPAASAEPSSDEGDTEFVTGWYYGRQVRRIVEYGNAMARFENETPGLSSHLLQGLAIDGSRVSAIRLSARIRTHNVDQGPALDAWPMLAISFYDSSRRDLGMITLGPYRGTRDWHTDGRVLRVPPTAKEAIVRIGLFGATGRADFDEVTVQKIGR